VIVQCDWRSSGYRSDWAREAWFRLSYRMESGNPAISFKVNLRKMIAPTATNGETGLNLASTVSTPHHRPGSRNNQRHASACWPSWSRQRLSRGCSSTEKRSLQPKG
jgi:hypothetical protein